MKSVVVAVSVLVMLGLDSVAAGAETTSTIQAVDPAARTVALDNGTEFVAHPSIDLAALELGAAVKVTYEERGEQKVIVDIQPVD